MSLYANNLQVERGLKNKALGKDDLYEALLHKLAEGQSFPFARQTYPVTSVIGVPRAVNPFRTATRI